MDLRDEYEDFRGGNGGAARVLGGESRLIRGGEGLLMKESETCLGVGLGARGGGLRTIGGLCLGTYGSGPSSTTQSFRSMSEVLRPRFGGDGDGEGGIDFPGVGEGRMGDIEVAFGEIGVSRRSGGDLEAMRGPPTCMASKALIRDFTAEDVIAAYTTASGQCRRAKARTSFAAGGVGAVDAGGKDASSDERRFRSQISDRSLCRRRPRTRGRAEGVGLGQSGMEMDQCPCGMAQRPWVAFCPSPAHSQNNGRLAARHTATALRRIRRLRPSLCQ